MRRALSASAAASAAMLVVAAIALVAPALAAALPAAARVDLDAPAAARDDSGAIAAARVDLDAILLVTVDTLRADRLGCYGGALGATPHLDRLAAESVVFRAAYTAAPSTLPAVSAMMTGRHPESFGLRDNFSVYPGTFPTLAQRLTAHGWRTAAVVSNWVLREHSGLAAGFERYDAVFPTFETRRLLPERTGDETTTAALRALDALDVGGAAGPAFVWVHYQDPHGPYVPPGGRREPFLAIERSAPDGARLLPALDDESGRAGIPRYQHLPGRHEAAWYRAGYDGEVSFADEEIGRLLAELDRRVPRSRSLVIVTADHGEGLGEDEYWFAHGELVSDALVRVPLLVRAPGCAPARRDDVASLVDVPQTIAAATGLPADLGAPGRDLLGRDAEAQDAAAYFSNAHGARVLRRGIATRAFRYVVTYAPEGSVESLHVAAAPVAADVPAGGDLLAAARLRFAAMRAAQEPLVAPRPAPLDAADRARLRALGYVE